MKKRKPANFDYDFTGLAVEITGDALYLINGGAEVENSHQGVANAQVGDTITRSNGQVVVINQGDIDYAQKQLGVTVQNGQTGTTGQTAMAPNVTAGGMAGGEITSEHKPTPQTYTDYTVQQEQTNKKDKFDKYKELGTDINNSFYNKNKGRKTGSVQDFSVGYGLVENLGVYASFVDTTYVMEDSKITLYNSASFSKKLSPDNFSYQYVGNVTLIVNNEAVETQKLIHNNSDKIYDPNFPPIGDCTFNTYIPDNANVKIKYDINLIVNNAYIGGTYSTKELF